MRTEMVYSTLSYSKMMKITPIKHGEGIELTKQPYTPYDPEEVTGIADYCDRYGYTHILTRDDIEQVKSLCSFYDFRLFFDNKQRKVYIFTNNRGIILKKGDDIIVKYISGEIVNLNGYLLMADKVKEINNQRVLTNVMV